MILWAAYWWRERNCADMFAKAARQFVCRYLSWGERARLRCTPQLLDTSGKVNKAADTDGPSAGEYPGPMLASSQSINTTKSRCFQIHLEAMDRQCRWSSPRSEHRSVCSGSSNASTVRCPKPSHRTRRWSECMLPSKTQQNHWDHISTHAPERNTYKY